jgi:hypothetical protein
LSARMTMKGREATALVSWATTTIGLVPIRRRRSWPHTQTPGHHNNGYVDKPLRRRAGDMVDYESLVERLFRLWTRAPGDAPAAVVAEFQKLYTDPVRINGADVRVRLAGPPDHESDEGRRRERVARPSE